MRQTGNPDLKADASTSVEEIDAVLDEVRRMPEDELTRQIRACQNLATTTYTHEAYCAAVEEHLREALAAKRPDLAARPE